MISRLAISKRSIQTTITFPLDLYIQLIGKAKEERVSLSEIVRKAVFREFEKEEHKEPKE